MPLIDQQRERLQDDLRGLVSGEVRCDDLSLQLHASDASIYEMRPLAVVRPVTTDEVAACVRYARDHRLPIHARGAGTGAAGESIGHGIVIDFSKYMRRLIRSDADRIQVQPGIVLDRLDHVLYSEGKHFPPDPGQAEVRTLGGLLALDSAGSRWLKYGSPHRFVQNLQVVLADGETLELGREPLVDGESTSAIPRKKNLIDGLAKLLRGNATIIQAQQPKSSIKKIGYNLDGVLGEDFLDVARLLVGSEGTLGLITEATLEVHRLPGSRGVMLFMFSGMEKAAGAVMDILPYRPTACELMDRRHLSLVREAEVRFDILIPQETEALLLVELESENTSTLYAHMQAMIAELSGPQGKAFGVRQTVDPTEAELFWRIIDRSPSSLHQLKGMARPTPLLGDMIVPVEQLADSIVLLQTIFKRHQVTTSLFAHAGQGQLLFRPYLDVHDPETQQKLPRMIDELYHVVFEAGGTITGESGYGLSRTNYLPRQAGPLQHVFREVKRLFDPDGLLNPGKIIGDDPELNAKNLSPAIPISPASPTTEKPEETEPQMRDLVELQIDWHPTKVTDAVELCNRCGACRTLSTSERMCPIFRISPYEEASPRAKVNLIRGFLTGKIELNGLTNEQFKQIADLCVHCHACRLECPEGVDVPRIMSESKGAYVAANGLNVSQWAMTHLDGLAALAGLISPAANWALGNRQCRWLMERLFGIAQGRKLPRVTTRNFLRRAARRGWTKPARRNDPKVVYFVDTFANYFDPRLAEATVRLFEHNGVSVFVPTDQKPAGMASFAMGALDHARRLASHNVEMLAEAIRQGYHIITSEPAAALCLTREYPQLLDDEDSRLVAAHTSDACGYLWKMHTTGKLELDFKPLTMTLGYHTPCHLRALQIGRPGENLLSLIPGLRVLHIEEGCSGMAGTFGLHEKNYRTSLRAGLRLITRLRDPHIQAGATECSACRMQMEQGTEKPTIHPLKLLAHACGLMPDLLKFITQPSQEPLVLR